MARKTYLGGSTIIGRRDDSYRLENTPHEYIEDYEERPRALFGRKIADDLFQELDGFGFYYLSELFSTLQHAFLDGDLRPIMRMAEDDEDLGSYTLRLMNKVIIGRKFDKQKGKIVIRKDGKLRWDARQIVAVYRAMIAAYDAEYYGSDEVPDLHPQVLKFLERQSSASS